MVLGVKTAKTGVGGGGGNLGWCSDLEMETSGTVTDYLSLRLSKSSIKLNNLKTSLRFPCLDSSQILEFITPYNTNHTTLKYLIWPVLSLLSNLKLKLFIVIPKTAFRYSEVF